jgi:hypothetical protein
MFWAAGLAGFCFRTWRSSADCRSHLKSMLFRKLKLVFLAQVRQNPACANSAFDPECYGDYAPS